MSAADLILVGPVIAIVIAAWAAIYRGGQVDDRPQDTNSHARKEAEAARCRQGERDIRLEHKAGLRYQRREHARELHYDKLNRCKHGVMITSRCLDCDYLRSIADSQEGR